MSDRVLHPGLPPIRIGRLVLVLAGIVAAAVVVTAGMQLRSGLSMGASHFNALYAVSGLLVDALVGLTGVGGGSLMTPLLMLLFGFHPSAAVGTDLLYASATKTVGAGVHSANRTIDWGIVGWMALGSVPATLATVAALYAMHLHGENTARLVSTVLGYALLVTATVLLVRKPLFDFAARRSLQVGPRATAMLTVTLGAVLGALITLSSVGAGAIGVTVLVFLYPKMPAARIVGSDIAHAVPLTLIAGVGHWALGSVNFPLLGSLLVGSIPGVIIGSQLTARIPEAALRPVIAVVLVLVGAKLAF